MKVLIFRAKELNTGEFLISDMANFPFLCQDDGEMTPLKIAQKQEYQFERLFLSATIEMISVLVRNY